MIRNRIRARVAAYSKWGAVGVASAIVLPTFLGGFAGDEAPRIVAGAREAAACYSCHGGSDRRGNRRYPNLMGRDPSDLVAAMEAYSNGSRNHPLMRSFVSGLSASERATIASFYAGLRH